MHARSKFVMVFVGTVLIRFLDGAARWCVVPGNGKVYRRAIVKGELFLHQALAERAASHDSGTVQVLHCAGQYLACRG